MRRKLPGLPFAASQRVSVDLSLARAGPRPVGELDDIARRTAERLGRAFKARGSPQPLG